MIAENQIVPFEVSELPTGPWLVFAPHADDETFGMGGALLCARAAGIRTELVVITDGAMGGEQDDLVAIREQEARQAANYLGFEKLSFLREKDRGLEFSEVLAFNMTTLIEASRAKTVFFPAVMELHPDHRAAAQLVWRALQLLADDAVRAVSYEISVQSPVNCLLDISAQVEGKKAALALYKSQLEQNNYIDIVLALNKTRSFTLPESVSHAEGFYCYRSEQAQHSLQQIFEGFTSRLFPG